ncbi:MAG: HAMP domain-containing histidine kinase [Spirochaetales bacterium]|nr:HAMP domain-containing histidine kinase [Spirochaetales bacterium]
MNTGTGFIFLVLTILIVPVLMLTVVMPTVFNLERPVKYMPSFKNDEELLEYLEEASRVKHPADSPEVLLFLVIQDDAISMSNIEGIPEGSVPAEDLLADFIYSSSNPGSVQFVRHIPGVADMIIVSLPVAFEEFLSSGKKILRILPATMLLSVVLITTIISLLILRNLNRNFRKLERGAEEISSGNLDYEISIPGNDYFASYAKAFNNMRTALKEEKERESRFIMGISHDLKTPLTLIGGYTEALADDVSGSPEERENYVTIIQRKLRDLDKKIDTLIDYRRMETGEWKTALEKIRLFGLLEEICGMISEDADFMKLHFNGNINIPVDYVTDMDQALFRRALDNIISNSFRYTPEGGRVDLTAYMQGGSAVIEISDSGCGIESGELNNILEPFYRASRSRREPGFGLGLSIVKSIADAHGWNIEIASEPGFGTKVILSGI